MGATVRTFAVRRAASSDVRQSLVSWLRAKGFVLAEGPFLFPLDAETERRVLLSENQDWTIVAYSHELEEGDRLVFELKKLRKPLLELWVYDSDIWGYASRPCRTASRQEAGRRVLVPARPSSGAL